MTSSLQTTIRDLHRRRGRERRSLTLAEGVRLVEEALAAGVPVRGAVASPALEATPRGAALLASLERTGARLERVSEAELDALADTEHPQGVVAVVAPRAWTLADLTPAPRSALVVLDAVQDPGNVGTILRTALGLGAAGAVALKGTAELANPKVLRGSMGAAFRLPAVATDAEAFVGWARDAGVELWAAAMDGEPLDRAAAARGTAPVAIVVGNEGAGLTPEVAAAARRRVAIPLAAAAESLNVAVAAGILLYEVTRGG